MFIQERREALTPERATLLGSGLITVAIFTHLGYQVTRNVSLDHAAETEKRSQLEASREQYKRTQEKAAWDAAIHKIDVELEVWLTDIIKGNNPKKRAKLYLRADAKTTTC